MNIVSFCDVNSFSPSYTTVGLRFTLPYNESENHATLHSHITEAYVDRFSIFFTAGFSKKFAIKLLSCFSPHFIYTATLPGKCKCPNYIIFWIKALTKTSKKMLKKYSDIDVAFIWFTDEKILTVQPHIKIPRMIAFTSRLR